MVQIVTDAAGVRHEFPDEATPDMMAVALGLRPDAAVPMEKSISTRGAPATVRAAVGAAGKSTDRLETLRRYYPDAQPYGEGNFVFTDPDTGLPTIFNPEGFDPGDIAGVGPEISEFAGGAIGAALAVPAAAAAAAPTAGLSALAIPAGYGLGAAAGREAYEALAKTFMGTADTRGGTERAADIALTAGANAIAPRVGELAARGVSAALGPVVSPAVRAGGQAVDRARQALADFANVGVPPSAGAVTGSRAVQMIEKGLANTPGGAPVMQRLAEEQTRQLAEGVTKAARSVGTPMTKEASGEVIQTGAKEAGDRFAANRMILDDEIENLIGAETRVPVSNARALLDKLNARIAAAPQTQGPQLRDAREELRALISDATGRVAPDGSVIRPEGIPFGALRQARTALGAALDRPDVTGYSPKSMASLRAAYGAIKGDIEGAAKAAGPDAERALRMHDRYVRFRRETSIPTLDKIAKIEQPEAAFNFAMSQSKDGATRLRRLRNNLTKEQWGDVTASVLDRMGRAKGMVEGVGGEPAEFSVATFLTGMKNLSPEARAALFGGSRYADLSKNVDELTRVARKLQDAEKMANPSGTARNILVGASAGAAGKDIMEGEPGSAAMDILAVTLAPRVAAKLITNPSVVRALATGVKKSPATLSARLAIIAKAEPEVREEVHEFIDALRQAPLAGRQTTQRR